MALSKIETASLDVGQIGGRRNIIINGDMRINQRQVGVTSITGAADTMMVDRFACFAGTGAYNAEQSTDAPSGFSYSLKATCTSVGTDDSEVWFQYKPEAQDLAHLDYGSSDAKDFTLSFWVKSTTTGQAGIYFYQSDGNRAYQGRYTINSSNTWEYKSVTIPGDPSGLFNNDNGVGLEVRWYLAGKTGDSNTNVWGTNTQNRSPSTWDVLSTVGNVFAITGVQMEVGDTATPFEHRTYGEELLLCQRYYERIQDYNPQSQDTSGSTSSEVLIGLGLALSSTRVLGRLDGWKVTKRVPPTVSISTNSQLQAIQTGAWYSATNTPNFRANIFGARADFSHGGSFNAGGAVELRFDTGAPDAYIEIDAEL